MIPKDPVMLLSYVNTQLRDYFQDLEGLCSQKGIDKEGLLEKMDGIGYRYEPKNNQFTAKGP